MREGRIGTIGRIDSIAFALSLRVVLWDTACNFNAVISNQSLFNCLITSASCVTKLEQDLQYGSTWLE